MASSVQTQPGSGFVQNVNVPSLPLGSITGMDPWRTPGGTAASANVIGRLASSDNFRTAGFSSTSLSEFCPFCSG